MSDLKTLLASFNAIAHESRLPGLIEAWDKLAEQLETRDAERQKDMETLLGDHFGDFDWEPDHDDILARWRANQPNGGMTDWRWWVGGIDDELYSDEVASRAEAIARGKKGFSSDSWTSGFQIIEARCWNDTIEGDDEARFAQQRNHEKFPTGEAVQ